MFKSGMTRRQFAVSAAALCAMTAFGAGLAFAEDKKEEAAEKATPATPAKKSAAKKSAKKKVARKK